MAEFPGLSAQVSTQGVALFPEAETAITDSACNTTVMGEDRVQGMMMVCAREGLPCKRTTDGAGTRYGWGGGKSSLTTGIPLITFLSMCISYLIKVNEIK